VPKATSAAAPAQSRPTVATHAVAENLSILSVDVACPKPPAQSDSDLSSAGAKAKAQVKEAKHWPE
jgi:hypothetical protein